MKWKTEPTDTLIPGRQPSECICVFRDSKADVNIANLASL